jgi:hypothetical protein
MGESGRRVVDEDSGRKKSGSSGRSMSTIGLKNQLLFVILSLHGNLAK